MRNFVAFFKRFQIFLVFAVLQIIALTFHFSSQSYPRARFMSTTSKVGGSFMEFKYGVVKHFGLSEANLRLQAENIELKRQLPKSLIPLSSDKVVIEDTLYRQQYEYIPATVLNSTFDKQNNFLTINRGSLHGIERGMGVFNDEGAVGYVFEVSEHFSLIKTLISQNVNLDVSLPDGTFGLLKWNGRNHARTYITGVANDIDIEIGEEVRTRGTRGSFPRGVLIGHVAELIVVEGDPLWDLQLDLAVDFRKIKHVYIIKNLLKSELDNLELVVE
jgi:rod shape-determining protein MreC